MRQIKGICSECGEDRWYKHKAKKLCAFCNEARKTKDKLSRGKTPYRYVKKPTGEAHVFREIWNSRPHECEHCGKPLDLPRAHYFAHQKSKGAYPELRLDPDNIKLFCFDFSNSSEGCHYLFDHGTKEQFEERKDRYR